MGLLNDIPELVKADVISEETANRIRDYYRSKEDQSQNRLFVIFGILGAILVGLGIILIIAHNWDEFSRPLKTVFAFLPLVIAQAICLFILVKQKDNVVWYESGAAFLFFSVAASISLVSQIYNISGDLSGFLLVWMLLCIPIIYVMNSSISSLLYVIGITWYSCEKCYWNYPRSEDYLYWLLFLLILPHYYFLLKKKSGSNFTSFHNWIVPISVIIALGTVVKHVEEVNYIAYMSLFGMYYLIGNSGLFKEQKPVNNGYRVLGSAGTNVLLLALTFDWFWKGLIKRNLQFSQVISSPEFIAAVILTLVALVLLYFQKRNKPFANINPTEPAFILFIIIFLMGLDSGGTAIFLVNALVFVIGLLTIRKGAANDHLGVLNYGLLIITALIVCRFFDTDLSFITRGILFIAVGAGFFAANIWMHKKRKHA